MYTAAIVIAVVIVLIIVLVLAVWLFSSDASAPATTCTGPDWSLVDTAPPVQVQPAPVQVQPASVVPWNTIYNQHDNADLIPGTDMWTISGTATPQTCATRCLSTPGCKGFTLQGANCWGKAIAYPVVDGKSIVFVVKTEDRGKNTPVVTPAPAPAGTTVSGGTPASSSAAPTSVQIAADGTYAHAGKQWRSYVRADIPTANMWNPLADPYLMTSNTCMERCAQTPGCRAIVMDKRGCQAKSVATPVNAGSSEVFVLV